MMRRLILVDHASQALTVKRVAGRDEVVALTADAMQALETCGVRTTPVCDYADTYALASADHQLNLDTFQLAVEVESYIAERYPEADVEGPGILSGHSYYLQYSVCAIAKRGHLIRETVLRLKPEVVTIFATPVHEWFSRDGYTENPWVNVARELAIQLGFRLDVIRPDAGAGDVEPGYDAGLLDLGRRAYFSGRRKLRALSDAVFAGRGMREGGAGLRVLNVHGDYDWGPVFSILKARRTASVFQLRPSYPESKQWLATFEPRVTKRGTTQPIAFDIPPFRVEPSEREQIRGIVDAWVATRKPGGLVVNGINCLPGLVSQMRETAAVGPAFVRYTDDVIEAVLQRTNPHAVCFMGMPSYSDQRLAFRARSRKIPVLCYQHAFGYGVQVQPKDEQTEVAHADYFLTYGNGIRPRPNATFTPRARYVSVGSTRLERMARRPRATQRRPGAAALKVLWVGEVSFRNTYAVSLTEDTRRFVQERQCLERLGTAPGVRVTYRPYRFSLAFDGTQRWLDGGSLPHVRTDLATPFAELVARHDVVVMETSSPTAWAEAIALRRPMILYCDPRQNSLVPDFAERLGEYCHWCRTSDELAAAVQRLAEDGESFVRELESLDCTPFLHDYALHWGNSAERVVSFLDAVCCSNVSLEQWQDNPARGFDQAAAAAAAARASVCEER